MEHDPRRLENDYTEIIQRLPLSRRLAYGTGHVLNDICASMWFTYLLVFFHLVLGFEPTLCGVVLLIGQVADALATPFVGLHSDENNDLCLCKYGRRKSWHLLGTVCVVLAFPFIFSPCVGCQNAHQWAQLVYYAAFVIIFQFGWAAVQISHLSLVPELTPTDHERTQLIAIRYTFTVFSNVLVYCIMWGILHITSDSNTDAQIGPGDVDKFQKVVFIGIGIGLVASFIFHIFLKEGANGNGGANDVRRRNSRTVSVLLRDTRLYQVACVYMPTRLYINLCQIYIPMYLHVSLSMPAASLAYIPLTMFVSSFLISLFIEKLNTRLGRKIAYSVGALLAISASIWIQFGNGDMYVTYEIYPVAVILGSAGSIMLVTSLGVCADLIGQNTESGAFIYGVMSFTDKLSNGLAVMLIQYLVKRCSSGCSVYYRDILTYVCGGCAVFGLLTILYMKSFSRDVAYNSLHRNESEGQEPSIENLTNGDTEISFSGHAHVT